MSGRALRGPIEPLLKVQQRRIDRTMAQVRDANHKVVEAQLTCEAVREELRRAEAARRQQIEALARRIELPRHRAQASPSGDSASLLALHLTQASSALDWWRARVEEEKKRLHTAELALAEAQAALAVARRAYREECARKEAMLTLAKARREEEDRARLRMEESATEDLLHARFVEGRGGLPA